MSPDGGPGQVEPVTVPIGPFTFTGLDWRADGPERAAVLLLHGFPQHSRSWAPVAQRLASAGIRAVAVDQRGYCAGARPSEVADYRLALLVADAVGMLQWLGAPAHLVGHDWGGVVGWQVAARHPDLLRSWTAVSTPNPSALDAVLGEQSEPGAAQRRQLSYLAALRDPGAADALLADGGSPIAAWFGAALSPARVQEDVSLLQEPGALRAALCWYRAMADDDAVGVPRISVPTTYVWGDGDLAFGRAAAEGSAAFVDAEYEFVALDGASHWLPDEAPDTLADLIATRVLGS